MLCLANEREEDNVFGSGCQVRDASERSTPQGDLGPQRPPHSGLGQDEGDVEQGPTDTATS